MPRSTARNAFAPVKGDEQHQRYGFSLNGPLWKSAVAGAFRGRPGRIRRQDDRRRAAGRIFCRLDPPPNDTLNFLARLEVGLTASQVLRTELQRNHTFSGNLGVGDFDLPERGYSQGQTENVLRAFDVGIAPQVAVQRISISTARRPTPVQSVTTAPAVLVLNAFNSGGAQIGGSRGVDEIEVADDLDISRSKHAMRAGFLIEGGRYRTDELRNTGGTFTFASLDAYASGQPTTFSRNVGDPRVVASQVEAGLYIQDDYPRAQRPHDQRRRA